MQGFFNPCVALGDRPHLLGTCTQQVQRRLQVPDSSPQVPLPSSLGKAVTLPISQSTSAPWSLQRWGREVRGGTWPALEPSTHTLCPPPGDVGHVVTGGTVTGLRPPRWVSVGDSGHLATSRDSLSSQAWGWGWGNLVTPDIQGPGCC